MTASSAGPESAEWERFPDRFSHKDLYKLPDRHCASCVACLSVTTVSVCFTDSPVEGCWAGTWWPVIADAALVDAGRLLSTGHSRGLVVRVHRRPQPAGWSRRRLSRS